MFRVNCKVFRPVSLLLYRSSRLASSSSFLINDPKFSWLGKELELQEKNPGVFDGSWHASGKVLFVMHVSQLLCNTLSYSRIPSQFIVYQVTQLTLYRCTISHEYKSSSLPCTGVPLVMSTSHPAYLVQVYH